MTSLVRFLKL